MPLIYARSKWKINMLDCFTLASSIQILNLKRSKS